MLSYILDFPDIHCRLFVGRLYGDLYDHTELLNRDSKCLGPSSPHMLSNVWVTQARFLKWPAHPTTRCLMTFLMSCLTPAGNLTHEANTRSYKPHGELWHHRKEQEVSISYWNTQVAVDGCDLISGLLEQSSTTVSIWQCCLLSWHILSTWENVFPRRDEDYFHVSFDMEVIEWLLLLQCSETL